MSSVTDPYDSYVVLYEFDNCGWGTIPHGQSLTIPLRNGAVCIIKRHNLLFQKCKSLALNCTASPRVKLRLHGDSDFDKLYRDLYYTDTRINSHQLRDWSGERSIVDRIQAVSWAIDGQTPQGIPPSWDADKEDPEWREPDQIPRPPLPADLWCVYFEKTNSSGGTSSVGYGQTIADSQETAVSNGRTFAENVPALGMPHFVNKIHARHEFCRPLGKDYGNIPPSY